LSHRTDGGINQTQGKIAAHYEDAAKEDAENVRRRRIRRIRRRIRWRRRWRIEEG
jgi:hypothetical protein